MARGATGSRTRKARPGLEPLEGRQLLDGGGISFGVGPGAAAAGITLSPVELQATQLDPGTDPGARASTSTGTSVVLGAEEIDEAEAERRALAAVGVTISAEALTHAEQRAAQTGEPEPPPVKTLRYATPQGVRVAVNLTGPGTLAGSQVREDGTLDLIFDGTGPTSQLFAHATGPARLGSMRDVDVPIEAQAGAGANQIGLVNLRPFSLVDGGAINLIGGVRRLIINNIGANTEVFLRELPEVAAAREAQLGRATTFATDPAGGVELVLTDGNFFPILQTVPEVEFGPPPGIRIVVAGQVAGRPVAGGAIGNPQLYGYDAADGQLIRFDTVTGEALQTIDVPSLAPSAGVTTTKVGGRLLVLVGQADQVRAFDALDGGFVGQFSTADLGITAIDGMGTTDLRTVLVDSTSEGVGVARAVNVQESLATGQAVATTPPFRPRRQFDFLGGATGVPGFDPLAVLGRGFFDEFQPTTEILGVMALDTVGRELRELNRVGAPGLPQAPPAGTDAAVGSIDGAVARVTGVSVDPEDGLAKNDVSLVSRTTFARIGTTRLDHPNLLGGLSESFRPELEGTAVFDIQGDVQAFVANDVRGLVLNTLGTLHLVGINRARDSFIVGYPLNHVYLGPGSQNVTMVTPAPRPPGTRPDVTVVPGLLPIGPLFIP